MFFFQKANNKGADQTARMGRLVCACVVRKPPKTGFLASGPIYLAYRYYPYTVTLIFGSHFIFALLVKPKLKIANTSQSARVQTGRNFISKMLLEHHTR